MNELEIKNAIITSAELDIERGLSAWLMLDYGGTAQGFGGYCLHIPKGWKHHKVASPFAGHFILRVMEIAGVEKWSRLVGKTIRVKSNHCGIEAIGHIVKDDWFNPKEDFQILEVNNPSPSL